MLNKLLDRNRINNIYDHLCLNVRSGRMICQICETTCPVNSIDLDGNKIEIQENCIRCGLCATACPTGVFDDMWAAFTRVVNIRKEQRSSCVIKCHKTEFVSGAIVINCLGELTPELAFYIVQQGIDKINIFYQPEACSDCECSTGQILWEDNRKKLRLIYPETKGIFMEQNDPASFELSSHQEINYSRRFLLRNLSIDAKEMMADLIVDRKSQGGIQETYAQNISLRRELLIKMLNKLEPEIKEKIEPGYLRHPEISAECTFCGSCAVLCPSGAMKITKDEENIVFLSNTPSECNMCGLCAVVCPEKAINMEVDGQNSSTSNIILQKTTVRNCVRCDREYYPKNEASASLCKDCEGSKFKPDELWFMK
ncbi:MAG TPA: 4Fe-4S binding protein [Syntrophomonadaceae bacterium]|nr:4Fe-4S binding protein [Syntrophomonadaceae bacterium]